MGLGFDGLSLGNAETVFKNAMDQGMVKEGVFAFALGDNKEGELTFGGVGEYSSCCSVLFIDACSFFIMLTSVVYLSLSRFNHFRR